MSRPIKPGIMTRRHFQAIADIISGMPLGPLTRDNVAWVFAKALADYNDAFDREKFLKACHYEQTP